MAAPDIVDLHAHYVPHELVEQVEAGDTTWLIGSRNERGGLVLDIDGRDMYMPRPGLYTLPDRIEDMDRTGVRVQVMSAAPFLFYYWADPALALRMVTLTNQSMARAVADHPDRLKALASVAMPHPNFLAHARAAIEELGLHGFALGPDCGDEQFDGPRFRAIFRLAAEMDVPIFIHPWNRSAIPGLTGSYLVNLIGNPMGTTIALGRFAFSGVLDELPGLRTVWAHLGGYAALAASRLQHGARVRPESKTGGLSPAQVFQRIWIDALNHDIRAVLFAADVLGHDRVVLGTDYCFDMGVEAPAEQVAAVAAVDPELARRIAWRNAHDVLPGLAVTATA